MKLTSILKKHILKEYSEKTILSTIERWKKENSKVDDNLAKQLIQRFDQVKSSIAQKLNIVALPDELKKGNNYLNIDKYSFDDMVKLIRSIPENPDKVKKEAVNKFAEKEHIAKPTAQSYVTRFLNKKDELKYAVENGTEDGHFSKEEVAEFIPNRLLMSKGYLDPRNWSWGPFEAMLDALFPSQGKAIEGENEAITDADKIYDKDGIEIYKGDDVNKCISYNPLNKDNRKTYGWCVTQPGNTNYDHYRFSDRTPTFYFIFDRSLSSEKNGGRFANRWHAFVIQVNSDGKSYVVTSANNDSDTHAKTWADIANIVTPETWNKIKNLEKYFQPVGLSAVERGRKFASGMNLSLDEFKELSQDDKILYVQGKASKDQLKSDIKKILPDYKISYEGRSTTLANVAIDSGQSFSWDELKDNEAIARRYAIFRYRHTDYGKKPIPLPFIKYLDESAQEKYYKTFEEGFLRFDQIAKYFNKDITEKYIEKQTKNLDFLTPDALPYIKNPKISKIYESLFKMWSNWEILNADKNDDNVSSAEAQSVNPKTFTIETWRKLGPESQNLLIALTEKYSGKEEYVSITYGMPFIVIDGSNIRLILNKNSQDEEPEYYICDKTGKPLSNKSAEEVTIDEYDINDPEICTNKVVNSKNVMFDGEPLNTVLKEEINWTRYKLQRAAGILR
jgi:hypothetical protein